ncbi:MAG: hypothetical protein R2844_19690 [Caldilineales bacterium]
MDEPFFCQIRVKGHLDDTWSDWFEGLSIDNLKNGEATLRGYLPDQAALQGVLNQINSLGLTLISVSTERGDN